LEDFAASRTALFTSLLRAAHTRLDLNPLIEDSWGERLVPPSVRAMFSDEALLQNRAYANVVTRSRYAEDALQAAVTQGIRQYVLIGAGFDSFALRRPAFAAELQIFEIDYPPTQSLKRQRIAECGVTLPDSVHFIAADLAEESVASALSRSSYRKDQLTFFSWLGVTMYLTREANLATLQSIASSSPPGSELVFTYFDARLFQTASAAFQEMKDRVASIGEPFLSGFDPGALGADLAGCGLSLIEDLDGGEVAARYQRVGERSLGPSNFSHIALASVRQGKT
jgi:methyltransferase (TIGR00027 family)